MLYRRGMLVATPLGDGTVNYVRMKGPDYNEVAAVSVTVHDRIAIGYSGTIFKPDEINTKPGALERFCPKCKAEPFEMCRDAGGEELVGVHLERAMIVRGVG